MLIIYLIFSALFICYFSLVEWSLHRFVMHKNLKWFSYPFKAHAVTHHGKFKADNTYHGNDRPNDIKKIPMAWWNGPVLVLLASIPAVLLSYFSNHIEFFLISILVGGCYYGAYEYIHWCMHLPRNRRIEFWSVFRWLNGHHLLHHRYAGKKNGKNYNVVFPLWDWLLGTLTTMAETPFAQARGPSVPDVQPK